ncbi:MAG: hypothetical protein HY098_04695 [Nitrospinae bacterium]|nr:hypothetical protein [Nitrospinota bacterium]
MKILGLSIPAILVLVVAAAPIPYFATEPSYTFRHGDESALVISFKQTGKRIHVCSEEEVKEYVKKIKNLRHSTNAGIQCGSRQRHSVDVTAAIDGVPMLSKKIEPSGWQGDTAAFVFQRFYLPPAAHRVAVTMRDAGPDSPPYAFEGELQFEPGKQIVVDFNGSEFKAHF